MRNSKQNNSKYYAVHREEILAKGRARYHANHEKSLARNKKNREENREYFREYGRTSRVKLRKQCIEHYGGKCVCCGETTYEFLAFDHKNNDGNKQREETKVLGSGFVRWLIDNNFPDDIQILCHNCNCARGWYGTCPHQRVRSNENNHDDSLLQAERAQSMDRTSQRGRSLRHPDGSDPDQRG